MVMEIDMLEVFSCISGVHTPQTVVVSKADKLNVFQ
jgi:hypothetical protein